MKLLRKKINVKSKKEAPALPTWASNFGINLRCAWGRLGLFLSNVGAKLVFLEYFVVCFAKNI